MKVKFINAQSAMHFEQALKAAYVKGWELKAYQVIPKSQYGMIERHYAVLEKSGDLTPPSR